MRKLKELIVRCWNNDVLRYIFFGGCTTLVNLCTFYILRLATPLDMNVANTIAVATSIVFAYFVNSRFVFESIAADFRGRFHEFCKFVGARLSTMVIEVGGVWLLVDKMGWSEFWVKTIIIQIIVLVLNYFSVNF